MKAIYLIPLLTTQLSSIIAAPSSSNHQVRATSISDPEEFWQGSNFTIVECASHDNYGCFTYSFNLAWNGTNSTFNHGEPAFQTTCTNTLGNSTVNPNAAVDNPCADPRISTYAARDYEESEGIPIGSGTIQILITHLPWTSGEAGIYGVYYLQPSRNLVPDNVVGDFQVLKYGPSGT